ncbi:hypothetical protein BpHYR1_002335, partial [Brachionus plicatilis]
EIDLETDDYDEKKPFKE